MTSIFNILKTDLSSLSLHTELLESCNWDEDLVKRFHEDLQESFETCKIKQFDTLLSIVDTIRVAMESKGWSNSQVNILQKIIKLHAKEISDLMKMEVN